VDTARAPSRAGCRGAECAERQLVYRHAGTQLLVLLQPSGAGATFVWGEITHSGTSRPCEGAQVQLLDEHSRELARSVSDAFGEFSFCASRLTEGSLAVEAGSSRFVCWLTPAEEITPDAAREGGAT
jgi:hypothetical protein